MRIISLGFISVKDADGGSLIAFPDGTVILKSEYHKPDGKPDCYIADSGEYYCGSMDAIGLLIQIDVSFTKWTEDNEEEAG